MSIPTEKTTQTGCLIERMYILLAESLDYAAEKDIEISFVSGYAPLHFSDDPWGSKAYENWTVVSVCYYPDRKFRCILSREGNVRIYCPGGNPDHTFQIPDTGVFGDAATGLGYVNRIRAIGDHLYVCGQSRQVYRFEFDGQDLASGLWRDFAGEMRQRPMPEPPDSDDEEAFDRWLDENDAIDLVDIDGPAEDDLYAVGDEVWHWDGQSWSQLELPTDEPLNAIKVLSPREIILVGHNGTLLAGNARTGFIDLSRVEDNQNFTSAEWFAEKLFLASNFGLHVYDPAKKTIEPYATDLSPDLQDTHILEAKDGILWSFGFKDLAWFDGKTWTRVDHPDNPPIR